MPQVCTYSVAVPRAQLCFCAHPGSLAVTRRFALSLSRRRVDSRWPFRGSTAICILLRLLSCRRIDSRSHFTAVPLVCASPLVAAFRPLIRPLAVACGALPYPAVTFFACALPHHMPRAPTPRVLQRWHSQPRQRARRRWLPSAREGDACRQWRPFSLKLSYRTGARGAWTRVTLSDWVWRFVRVTSACATLLTYISRSVCMGLNTKQLGSSMVG